MPATDCQQIVEIMGDAAGQLADRFHLLRLSKAHLGLLRSATSAVNWASRIAFLDPLAERVVRLRNCSGEGIASAFGISGHSTIAVATEAWR